MKTLLKLFIAMTACSILTINMLSCNNSNRKANNEAKTETSVTESDKSDAAKRIAAEKLEKLKGQMAKSEVNHDTYGLSINFDNFYSNPNYDIALDSFSFEELRLLRSIPYARNGHWFKEGEICEKLCTINQYIQDLRPVVKQYAQEKIDKNYSEYWQAWFDNYPKTYSLITLNDDEKAFVERVDEQIAKLNKRRYVDVEDVKLPNAQLLYNKSYVDMADAKFWNNLQKQNFAFENEQYSQLFNPYELYDNLPNYVTTDLYLHTYHMYFSWLLKRIESKHFFPAIKDMCVQMYNLCLQAADSAKNEDEKLLADSVATFYAIAVKLATGNDIAKLPASMKKIYNTELSNIMAEADNSSEYMNLKRFPYSLFKPRGNYTRSEEMKRYFRCLMWLQTANFKMRKTLYLTYQFKHSPDEIKKMYHSVSDAITFLMGEPDNVSIAEIADILDTELGITTVDDILNPQTMENAENIIDSKFAEHSKIKQRHKKTRLFVNFMPQRYVPDAEILNIMYDTVPNASRAYPCGLDVFDAFGSTTAANILDSTDNDALLWDEYKSRRSKMRGEFARYSNFDMTMYNKWFESLVVLQKKDKEWPAHMKTSAWERKNMNTALSSWAELKHDAILYSKEAGNNMAAECGDGPEDYNYPIRLPEPEYFQNYLEPNIAFWNKMHEILTLNVDILKKCGFYDGEIRNGTDYLIEEVKYAIRISEKELRGEKLTADEDEYLKNTGGRFERMTLSYLSTEDNWLEEWYEVKGADENVAVIADVFTRWVENCQNNGILYEAIGNANTIYVVVERNNQIYLTRGGVFDYREFKTSLDASRLTDEDWQYEIKYNTSAATKGRPNWMNDLFTKRAVLVNQKAGNRDYPFWVIHRRYDHDKETHEYISIDNLNDDSTYNNKSYLDEEY